MAKRAECPSCGMSVALNHQGRLMLHGRKRSGDGKAVGAPCPGTDQKIEPSDRGRRRK